MKKIYILLFVLVLPVAIKAQTNIGGSVYYNTQLPLTGSPYIVTSNLIVEIGATLTIDAGVIVKFTSGKYIQIKGTINATNTTFTSNNVTPAVGDWEYIQIGYSTTAGTAIFDNCTFEYARQIYVTIGTANFTGCTIRKMYYHGIENYGNTTITNSTINLQGYYSSYGYGLKSYTGSTTTISGSNFTNCNYCLSVGGTVSISSSNLQDGTYGIVSTGNLTANDVLINNFTQSGIYINEGSTNSLTNVEISSCLWPIYYYSAGALSIAGTLNIHNNTNNTAYVGFSNLYGNWTLPDLNPSNPSNLNLYIPYYFPSGFIVNEAARLTISSNSILKFENSTGLSIKGKITAQASPGKYIYFTSIRDDNWGGDTNKDGTSTSPAVNNWQGIVFQNESVDAECLLKRCKVRFGSYSNAGGITCYNAGPTIDSCEITNNYFGFYLKNASNPILTNNIIGSSLMTPIALSFEANPTFSNNILSTSDNQYDALGILGGEITADAVLPVRTFTNIQNITYVLLGVVTVPQTRTLTIAPGVVIKSLTYDNYLLIDGKIIMDGTAANPIVMTSVKDDNYGNPMDTNKDGSQTSPAVGDWGGILMRENSSNLSLFDYCIFKYAEFQYIYDNGYQYYDGCLLLRNSSPTITNCQFGNVVHGIMAKFASNPLISNCTFFNTQSTPIAMTLTANPTFSGNTFNNTALNGLGLLGETVAFSGTLKKRNVAGFNNITYVVLSDITISSGAFVSIEPGVVVKFNSSNSLIVNGGLKADGSSSEKIIFSSIHDDNVGNPGDVNGNGNATVAAAGNWGMVKYTGTSVDDSCKLNYCNFKYGSSGTVYYDNASGTLQNSTIESSLSHGMICNGNSEPVLNNVTFQNCTSAPVGMSLLSNPQFNQIIFTSNAYLGIQLIDASISSNATLNKRSIAGIDNVAYLIKSLLTINSDATLTINAGVVIKFNTPNNYGQIKVNGAIKTIGSLTEPVIFTSEKDDSVGGDTNNDGNNTTPAKGDWYCIELNSAAIDTENLFTNTKLRYGGYYNASWDNDKKSYGSLRIKNAFAHIEDCTFEQSLTSGLGVFGNSDPVILSNTFKNIDLTPVTMSMFSNPQFSGNSMSNIGTAALGIVNEDWSVDATIPKRNFAGYENITYFLFSGVYYDYTNTKISNGTTITIPEGVVFKFSDNTSYKNLLVNGKLICNGTAENPVVFTQIKDDAYGNPKDTNGDGSASVPSILPSNSWLEFTDISNDESIINHAIFRYQNDAVILNQASPTIKNCTFSKNNFGIRLNGVSEPVIDSCIFDNLAYTPLRMSLVSYPVSTKGNMILGSTYKALGVLGETLSQEITLHNRDFAGITGIPYYFHETYTIGTSGGITVEPGVILKFRYGQYNETKMSIKNYLTAMGGENLMGKIVFTDIYDDFYGGDTNSDSTNTVPGVCGSPYWSYSWRGLYFENESDDELCVLDNCIVGYAGNSYSESYYTAGINLTNASPTITNTCFLNNAKGITANGASNPLVNNCDFSGQLTYALENVNLAFTINAENCWWGKNSGPTHSGNPGGTGGLVTNGVDYLPFKTDGATIPITGDVSLNGNIQAYDAALVLQSAVGSITLNARQLSAADVSGNGTVTAYDASLILQYVIGFINYFPVWDRSPQPATKDGGASLLVESKTTKPGEFIKIPVWINDVSDIHSSDIVLNFDPKLLNFKELKLNNEVNALYSVTDGQIKIGAASSDAFTNNLRLATLVFVVNPEVKASIITKIGVEQFLADEKDFSFSSTSGVIEIVKNQAEPPSPGIAGSPSLACFPNPFNQELTIQYEVDAEFTKVNIEVLDLSGKTIKTLANTGQQHGFYQLNWNGQDESGIPVKNGLYLIRLITNEEVSVSKVHFIK
jgi:parallel beta-helix repeat protein